MNLIHEMTTSTLVWLFIVAFMLHDLEEIIWVEVWIKKNRNHVIRVVPTRLKKQLEKMFNITSGQFAFAVLLEFIIFIPFTFLAAEQGKFFIFLSFNTLFLIHVFTHVGQSIYLKMYTPGVVSAVIITLPYSLYLFYRLISEGLVTWGEVLLSIPVGLMLLPIVLLGHELGRRFVK
ncbi:hypothetical protein PGLA_03185 [Paenibacillus glacialis]|uniref:HXXEE domain-containing protein n=2 Tax=Paenibacillus glacialis TaxID=494026 RepID=A0A168N8Y4_9BACL|nr:hypothetical protein PGLA_03185 [Paenibacillus glacialis]